ncbi:PRTRC system protein C [Rugamonas sp. A1-17]|nr:PRTRC system protein C [Rugamonas sp. A1-17]
MTLQAHSLKRYFTFNGVSLQDPGPEFSPEEIKEMHSMAYPDLATAVIETEIGTDSINYKFVRSVGTKG